VPADGGAASLFSPGASVTPQMNAANGLVFVGSNLFVADSEGVIYEISPGGTATVWSKGLSDLSCKRRADHQTGSLPSKWIVSWLRTLFQ
jgi:hypothetical protein